MTDDSLDGAASLKQLRVISRVLILANADAIQKELTKYASTAPRQHAWALMDGTRTVPEIAALVKQTPRAINLFVAAAAEAGMVEAAPGKPPVRLLDYVPVAWAEAARALTQPIPTPEPATAPSAPAAVSQKTLSETVPAPSGGDSAA
jgi:hypothetical protein